MRKMWKVLVWLLVSLVVVLAVGITFTIGWRPFVGPRARTTSAGSRESHTRC